MDSRRIHCQRRSDGRRSAAHREQRPRLRASHAAQEGGVGLDAFLAMDDRVGVLDVCELAAAVTTARRPQHQQQQQQQQHGERPAKTPSQPLTGLGVGPQPAHRTASLTRHAAARAGLQQQGGALGCSTP